MALSPCWEHTCRQNPVSTYRLTKGCPVYYCYHIYQDVSGSGSGASSGYGGSGACASEARG